AARGSATVLRQVIDLDVARQLGQAVQQAGQAAARGCGSHRHRVATLTCGSSPSSRTGASGGTASRRSAPPTTPENTGAATSPPEYLPAHGSSSATTGGG